MVYIIVSLSNYFVYIFININRLSIYLYDRIYNTFMQDDIEFEIPLVDLKGSISRFQINNKDFRIEEISK